MYRSEELSTFKHVTYSLRLNEIISNTRENNKIIYYVIAITGTMCI